MTDYPYYVVFQDGQGAAWKTFINEKGERVKRPWLPPMKSKTIGSAAAGQDGILTPRKIDPLKRAAAEAMLTYCCHDLGIRVRPALFFERFNGRRAGVYNEIKHTIRLAASLPLHEVLYTAAHEAHHAKFAGDGENRERLERLATAYAEKIKQTAAAVITRNGFVQVRPDRPANVSQIRIYYLN